MFADESVNLVEKLAATSKSLEAFEEKEKAWARCSCCRRKIEKQNPELL